MELRDIQQKVREVKGKSYDDGLPMINELNKLFDDEGWEWKFYEKMGDKEGGFHLRVKQIGGIVYFTVFGYVKQGKKLKNAVCTSRSGKRQAEGRVA